jgi:hypothetical protein
MHYQRYPEQIEPSSYFRAIDAILRPALHDDFLTRPQRVQATFILLRDSSVLDVTIFHCYPFRPT